MFVVHATDCPPPIGCVPVCSWHSLRSHFLACQCHRKLTSTKSCTLGLSTKAVVFVCRPLDLGPSVGVDSVCIDSAKLTAIFLDDENIGEALKFHCTV